ncbi:MAG: hypothetical protein AB1801_21470 [Chloroflexota bacterium]
MLYITTQGTIPQRLEAAEAPRRLLRRLHRNPLGTMRSLLKQHAGRSWPQRLVRLLLEVIISQTGAEL